MSFIPGYNYDIFLSYASVDNIASHGQTVGWIEQFYKNLNLMLAKRFGRLDTIKIWWDNKKLDGSKVFDHSIEEGINNSAIIICINSPGYLASEYCRKELELFYNKVQNEKTGLKVAHRSRIVNVLINNVHFNEWPKELNGTSGFKFHDAREPKDFGETIDTHSLEYKMQMQKLRDAVWHLLNDFSKEQTEPDVSQNTVTEENTDAFTIYMGEVADTLRTPRKRIINELEKKGFNILTGIPPPDEVTAHELAIKGALKKSSLSIHLLDEYPGREITGATDICYPQKQTQIVLDSGKSQMIWVPAETDFETIEDENYKLFLQELEDGVSTAKGYEFIRGSKSTLAQEIIDFAEQLKAKQLQKTAEKGKLSVLLDTHFNDQLYALDLSRVLLENQIQPFINPQEDDPRKNINLLGDRISQVRKLIFLYGTVSKEWVLERMSAALQLIITNNYPIEDFFVYMAPPTKEANNISINQRFLKVNVFDNSKNQGIEKAELIQFVNALKTTTA